MRNANRLLNPLTLGAALLLTSFLARKGTATVWEAVADEAPPPENLDHAVRFRDAAMWAIVSGASVGLARVLVRRLLASGNALPKELTKSEDDVTPFV